MLHLDEDRFLVEQLRLILGNVARTVIPVISLAILLCVFLSNDSNAWALRLWTVAAIASNLNGYLYTRRQVLGGISSERAHHIVWMLMLLTAMDGALWGALPWITLDTTSPAGSILVVSVIAGMAAGAMATQSQVLVVFIACVIPEIGISAVKVWLLGGSQYQALAIAAALYLAALLGQARNTAQATRAAIQLRFDNTELLEQLRFKTAVAESARLEAETANSAKSKFLAAASHDLRQPIHAQGLFLAVLARTELTPHQQVLLSNARAASADSKDMLNKLLDFSRIEAGVIEPNLQPVGLQSLLHKIERDLAPQANEKDLVYRSRETHLSVRSDPVLLELILRNLVSNAIRYTERGGILVACRPRGDQAVLEVWDTGIGIAIEQQQAIFREFHQLGNPERDRSKGLGLGLAIAERLTQSLGHRLSLVSTPQRGSVFRLALPLVDNILPNQLELTTHIPVRLLNARVLVVDDDAAVCFGMLHLLRDWGCVCVAAQSIEEALVIANAQTLDLLICDYRLRGHRTGSECIAALRALLGQDIPALLVTGDTAPERLREAQGSGIPLLHKPVSPGQLYRRLVEILEATALAPERAHSTPVATPHQAQLRHH